MLQLKNIRKQYVTGDFTQTALDGVSLNLRQHELVAILGPSGSGKSTLLNVIGGLDQYDSGDLIINGISTKKYSDRDWDSYRNHTVGFVFQSYNLIPHQTVLANVELALTISGVPKSERRKRAVKALEEVGLGNQLHKKPNQMSGGQMQRVAIARALVNNPSIVLADEPTGALDSETSVQVMELLKEVSRDRLVVMVTHNPELAMQYADRIVRVKDGSILGDSDPFEVDESGFEEPEHRNMGKSSMSFRSALNLSFNNLKSKKGRTLLTAFAGSIGIIGIALIMSLSAGFQAYIDNVQEDTLANNPLTLQSGTADLMTMMMPSGGRSEDTVSGSIVVEQPNLSSVFEHIGSNDLGSFKTHLEDHYDEIGHTLNTVQYQYWVEPRIYAEDHRQVNPACMFRELTGNDLISAIMDVSVFQEMLDDRELLSSQYQLLDGRWPEAYNELVLVLPGPHKLSDSVAYTLGLKDLDSLDKMVDLLLDGQEVPPNPNPEQWDYEDLLGLRFRLVNVPDLYRYNEEYGIWEDLSDDEAFLSDAIDQGEVLNVVGILCPQEGSSATTLSPGIGYTSDLTRHIIDRASGSEIVQQQLNDMDTNVFNGQPFSGADPETELNFDDLISVDGGAISSAFGININETAIEDLMEDYLRRMTESANVDTTAAQQAFVTTLTDLSREMLGSFVADHADETGTARLTLPQVTPLVENFLASDSAQARIGQLSQAYSLSADTFTGVYRPLMVGLLTDHIARQMTSSMPQPGALTAEVLPTEAPAESVPAESAPAETAPAEPEVPETTLPAEVPQPTVPEISIPTAPEELYADFTAADVESTVSEFASNSAVTGAAAVMGKKMMEPTILRSLMTQVTEFGEVLARTLSSSFYVDADRLAGAFQLNIDEDELHRILDAMSPQSREQTAASNLNALGYADEAHPDAIALYMTDFDSKEEFLNFLNSYNEDMESSGQEEKVLRYTDVTGMMMESVRTIINTVSYALIAFVAVSLLVSSIMIGIITYISVMERTKEIGVLRAMGASKHNISQVFNAETFIIGLCSGLIGIGITLVLLIPGNEVIHHMLNNPAISARLPLGSAIALVVISMLLTLLGGLIPSHQAAKKDPVIALRSE